MIYNISFSKSKPLLAADELIVVLSYSSTGKSVILFVNINYLTTSGSSSGATMRCTIIQIDRWLPWLFDFHSTAQLLASYGYEYRREFSLHISLFAALFILHNNSAIMHSFFVVKNRTPDHK